MADDAVPRRESGRPGDGGAVQRAAGTSGRPGEADGGVPPLCRCQGGEAGGFPGRRQRSAGRCAGSGGPEGGGAGGAGPGGGAGPLPPGNLEGTGGGREEGRGPVPDGNRGGGRRCCSGGNPGSGPLDLFRPGSGQPSRQQADARHTGPVHCRNRRESGSRVCWTKRRRGHWEWRPFTP